MSENTDDDGNGWPNTSGQGSERNMSARPAVGNPKSYNARTYLLRWSCTSELYTLGSNWIQQSVCMVGTITSKGRVQKSTFGGFSFTSSKFERSK
jgi:hypothetical protein